MTRAELARGKHPFRITWSGYRLGEEKMYEDEDRTRFSLQRLLNPEAYKYAGIFYVRRWIWTPEKEFRFDENHGLQKGDVYYDVTFPRGKYSFKDIKDGHKALAKLASKDDKVSMIIGITWLNKFAKRWGWTTSVPLKALLQAAEIQEMVRPSNLKNKSLDENSIADQTRRAVTSRDFTPVLTFMTKHDLIKRYG